MSEAVNNFSIEIGVSTEQSEKVEQVQQQKKQKYVDKDDQFFTQQHPIEECLYYIYQQKQESYQNFVKITNIGNKITQYTLKEDLENLEQLFKENKDLQPYLTPYIEDAFEQILTLRYDDTIKFYLERKLNIEDNFQNSLIILTKTAKLFKKDPPVDTLKLLLKYGADPNQMENEGGKYRTALHLACKYGIVDFVVVLCACKKTEINPVDRQQKTPLWYAEQKKQDGKQYRAICDFLKEQGGVLDWRLTK